MTLLPCLSIPSNCASRHSLSGLAVSTLAARVKCVFILSGFHWALTPPASLRRLCTPPSAPSRDQALSHRHLICLISKLRGHKILKDETPPEGLCLGPELFLSDKFPGKRQFTWQLGLHALPTALGSLVHEISLIHVRKFLFSFFFQTLRLYFTYSLFSFVYESYFFRFCFFNQRQFFFFFFFY